MSIKAIIFDVDGTLAETEEGHRLAFNQAFADAGLAWHWDVPLYDKLLAVAGGKERIKYYVSDFLQGQGGPANDDDFVRRLHAAKTVHYTRLAREGGIPLRPGIRALIEAAHGAGLALAIATTTTPDNVTALLDAGLGPHWPRLFAAVGCGDIVPRKKPAPDIYFWVLQQLGLAAGECIALEDSAIGLAASSAAGVTTYITLNQYTRQQDFTGAAAVFEDLRDLPAFIRVAGLPLAGQPAQGPRQPA
jgi:HAD superfamily hydrolase (TIGR01509 family)